MKKKREEVIVKLLFSLGVLEDGEEDDILEALEMESPEVVNSVYRAVSKMLKEKKADSKAMKIYQTPYPSNACDLIMELIADAHSKIKGIYLRTNS